jgi:uncharacterized protein (TIGR02271 family)
MAMMSELAHGMKVMSSDGSSLGKIIRVEPEYFLVEKGFFFPKDYSIPISMVREIRDDACWLSVSREELEREDETLRASGTRTPEPRETGATAEAEQRLSLAEEELEARKRVRDAGEVVVKKEVVTEHRQIDVPVTKEEVHVERAPASAATASPPEGKAFEEETIRVPVREEEVEVTKRPRVREEVRVSKTARQEERRVEGEVRREEARVDRTDEESKARGYGPGRDDEP